MSKHTPEPWVATRQPNGSVCIHERGLMPHATVYGRADLSSGKIESDSARIVACVNACAGINPEAVPGLLAVCREIAEHGTDDWAARMQTLRAAIARAEGGAA